MIHQEQSPLAGTTVRIKKNSTHLQVPDFGGSEYRVEDWWDRLQDKSWKVSYGNPACIIYSLRAESNNLPLDDEVLYGKIGSFGHLVHISEVEID